MRRYRKRGQGVIKWIEQGAASPCLYQPQPDAPPEATLQMFRDICLCGEWLEDPFPDFDFGYLLQALRHQGGKGAYWLNEMVLEMLIDWHDAHGDLWRYVSSLLSLLGTTFVF